MDEVLRLDASGIADKVRNGEVSAVEVVDAHIRRIEQVDEHLNAVVIRLFDQAREQAAAADAALTSGDEVGPLHGVPVTIKEQYRVAGTQTTLGASKRIGNVYDDEGPLVTALRRAGAIVLGKTNIIQTLAGWESDNPVYGRSNNPWNLDRTPGGSSGGEAAIIAAGGSPLGLAGDLGGSSRVPAHFCGVHGFKPTSLRLTNADFATGLLGYGQEAVIPQPGPIARSVGDLQLAMKLFAATSLDLTFDAVPPVPWSDPDAVAVDGLRIGVYTDNGMYPVSPSIGRAVEEAVAALEAMGASVVPVAAPDPEQAADIFLGAMSAGRAKDFQALLGGEKPIPQVAGLIRGSTAPAPIRTILPRVLERRGQHALAEVVRRVKPGSADAYWRIVEARTRYRDHYLRQFGSDGLDAIVCPPLALPAFTHGASEHLFPAVSYAFTYNVLGAPAGVVAATRIRPGEEGKREPSADMAVRAGIEVERSSVGLPVGVQVVGPHWGDHTVLAVMATLERHFRGTADHPATPIDPAT